MIAAVTPWNVPLITPAWKWLPALCADERVAGIHFTGSERAGRALAGLAAPRSRAAPSR